MRLKPYLLPSKKKSPRTCQTLQTECNSLTWTPWRLEHLTWWWWLAHQLNEHLVWVCKETDRKCLTVPGLSREAEFSMKWPTQIIILPFLHSSIWTAACSLPLQPHGPVLLQLRSILSLCSLTLHASRSSPIGLLNLFSGHLLWPSLHLYLPWPLPPTRPLWTL